MGNNKKIRKEGLRGPTQFFFQKISIAVVIDIITRLLAPRLCLAVQNGIEPIASKRAHFKTSIDPLKNRIFASKNLSPPIVFIQGV